MSFGSGRVKRGLAWSAWHGSPGSRIIATCTPGSQAWRRQESAGSARVHPPQAAVLAPHANGLNQATLQQRSGLDPATCRAALAALSRHDVIVCYKGLCRYSVELMRRWVASGAATTEV